MLNKLLQVYENKILSEKTKKDLGWLGWGYIILGVVCLVSFLIFEIIHSYVAAVISITLLVVVSVAFIIVSNKLFKYDEQNLKQYKTETVDKFQEILKETGLYGEKTIKVIISQCEEYENDKGEIFWGERFKAVFTLVIYPVMTAVAAVIVKNMSDHIMIEWSIFIIGMIIIVYVMIALIYPVIADYTNKYKRIAKMMRQDLEYILAIKEQQEI